MEIKHSEDPDRNGTVGNLAAKYVFFMTVAILMKGSMAVSVKYILAA